jgi:hypothetical protein
MSDSKTRNLKNTKLYFTYYFMWVCNPVSHVKGTTQLGVFPNRVLRRISGAKRDEVTRDW